MKKLRIVLCLLLAVAVVTSVGAQAAHNAHVIDDANLLNLSELTDLEQRARELSDKYGCGVYIVTVFDYEDYGYSPYDAACNIFIDNGLGYGDGDDGVLLMLSMYDRDYSLISHGYGANDAFNDYAKDKCEDAFLDDFGDNEWYDGFRDYIKTSEKCLAAAAKGKPLSEKNDPDNIGEKIGISFVIAAIISIIICLILKGKMKSVRKNVAATQYMATNGAMLSIVEDTFTHVTTTRRTISESSRSGGGSSHSISGGGGSGFSGHSGKF